METRIEGIDPFYERPTYPFVRAHVVCELPVEQGGERCVNQATLTVCVPVDASVPLAALEARIRHAAAAFAAQLQSALAAGGDPPAPSAE